MQAHKVIWREGMLLRPQHLQHNDRYYDQQLNRTRLLDSDAWGFLTLGIDLQYLNLGKVVVHQASGVLPDGSLFELGTTMEPLVLDIPANCASQSIYLALTLATGNRVETRTRNQSDVVARYIACETEVSDSNDGPDSRCRIDCAHPDLRLLLGEQHSDHTFVKLKIAQVLDSSTGGSVNLDADFSPTFLYLQGSQYVLSCLKEVISLLASRGDAIAERICGSGVAASTQVGDFLMLQLINRTEPVLRHFLAQAQVRPELLYRYLLSILGELSTYAGENKRAPLDMYYQHDDQGASFRALMGGMRAALSVVLEQHAIELILQRRQYGVMVCPISDIKLLGTATFILAAEAQCDGDGLRYRLPAHLKIGPVERIRELVNLQLTGIKVRPLPVAPRQIPFHAGKTYFMLELTATDVSQLEQSGGFAFHVSGEFSELELNFWAIRN
ncbi:type VI secretion system baseplate subunit TssK [Pseudomonas sp. B6002]|uniref:type VI secretion system baseplate subunit TssK n=1 Tax=Pseudomonas sp. B6002 TaxID=2726978 RepID=UPI0015A329A0|nr:type VI secretion system baseplate subunit TssK [Pseudomonas sp. B6002]NVZ50493.1 type VI secretion system baseplate subunit TssK [Pseudomonas sp. B6002]